MFLVLTHTLPRLTVPLQCHSHFEDHDWLRRWLWLVTASNSVTHLTALTKVLLYESFEAVIGTVRTGEQCSGACTAVRWTGKKQKYSLVIFGSYGLENCF